MSCEDVLIQRLGSILKLTMGRDARITDLNERCAIWRTRTGYFHHLSSVILSSITIAGSSWVYTRLYTKIWHKGRINTSVVWW